MQIVLTFLQIKVWIFRILLPGKFVSFPMVTIPAQGGSGKKKKEGGAEPEKSHFSTPNFFLQVSRLDEILCSPVIEMIYDCFDNRNCCWINNPFTAIKVLCGKKTCRTYILHTYGYVVGSCILRRTNTATRYAQLGVKQGKYLTK